MKYFADCKTVEEIKKRYHKLCREWHPDLNPDSTPEIMAEINAEYEKAFVSAEKSTNGTETPEQFQKIINTLIKFQGLQIDIIGSWIWVSGKVARCLPAMKRLGFAYSTRRKMYYYNGGEKKTSYSRMSMEQIKEKYGCTTIKSESQKQIA